MEISIGKEVKKCLFYLKPLIFLEEKMVIFAKMRPK